MTITPNHENEQTIHHIDLTPTPEGMRQIVAMLRQQIRQSEEKVEQAEELLEKIDLDSTLFRLLGQNNITLLMDALEALISQERVRIQNIEDGLAPEAEKREE